jgi:hypothetical protein
MFATFQRCLLISLAVCPLAGTTFAKEFGTPTPQEGFLVLANGSVIQGVVAEEGAYFHVLLKKGKLQVRVDQVDFFCNSMEEAYVRRKARRIANNATADAHLDLARWCVQHELFACAESELNEARTLDPKHQEIPFVDRQLAQAFELANERSSEVEPVVDEHIQPAAAFEEQSSTAFGEIPTWARTEFIKRVQPMMVHSCATAGCHLTSSPQQMRIARNALDGVGSPELIGQNLSSVIAQINLAQPESSRLLVMGAAAHGIAASDQSDPLTPHQLEILRAWITQLALREQPAEDIEHEIPSAQVVIGMNSSAQKAALASESSEAASQDPFDPAAFNSEHVQQAEDSSSSEEANSQPVLDPAE